MQSFISKVVTDIITRNIDLSKTTIILPSHRAGLFVKQAFKDNCKDTILLPKIISIENFIADVSELESISSLHLMFEFYKVYKNSSGEKIDSFEQFYEWGTIALNDFNEIDRHLLNPELIFNSLADIKRIDDWSPQTPLVSNYLSFFNYLHTYYALLYKTLLGKKLGYQGMMYREAIQNLQHFIDNHQDNHFVFVGFNALNKSEELIFQELLEQNIASVYWDINQTLISSSFNIAYFLNKYKNEWKYYQNNPFLWIDDSLLPVNSIEIIGVPKRVSQLKYAGDLLNQQEDYEQTALILSDEQLLTVALNSLPSAVKNVNITMGFPLHITPAKDFFESLFRLIQLSIDDLKKDSYYYEDVLRFFNQPYILKLSSDINSNFERYIQNTIIDQQKLFIPSDTINEIINKFFENLKEELTPFFTNSLSSVKLLLQQIVILIEKLLKYSYGLDREYLYRFLTIFKELEWLNNSYVEVLSISTIRKLWLQLTKKEQLSFQGEPLSGLQIMGVLETRALDFKTLIITGLNEGVLPKGSQEFSFIPFELKKHFGLPTFIERDLIFSYHFFRLLQRAEKVYLMYNSETDALGASEKSRFLTQLEVIHPQLKHVIVSPKVENNPIKLKQIIKTPEALEKVRAKLKDGISPSALAAYIRNPLEFYQKYVLNIWESPEIEETIEANTFGNIIHKTLEYLFLPYLNTILTIENIKEINERKAVVLDQQFNAIYKQGDLKTGKNRLLKEVARTYIDKLIDIEQQQIQEGNVIIKSLENEYSTEIYLKNLDLKVKLKGNIDRIDIVDNQYRIVDYKTGKVSPSDLKMTDFDNLTQSDKKLKAIQLLLYAYIFLNQPDLDNSASVMCGNISFKNIGQGYIKINISTQRNSQDHNLSLDKLSDFIESVKELITEILNPDMPFTEKEVVFYKG